MCLHGCSSDVPEASPPVERLPGPAANPLPGCAPRPGKAPPGTVLRLRVFGRVWGVHWKWGGLGGGETSLTRSHHGLASGFGFGNMKGEPSAIVCFSQLSQHSGAGFARAVGCLPVVAKLCPCCIRLDQGETPLD